MGIRSCGVLMVAAMALSGCGSDTPTEPSVFRVEDIVVGAYNGAIPAVLSKFVRELLVRIVHVEAQHAASFGTVAAPAGFDAVLSQAVVIQRFDRYVRA